MALPAVVTFLGLAADAWPALGAAVAAAFAGAAVVLAGRTVGRDRSRLVKLEEREAASDLRERRSQASGGVLR